MHQEISVHELRTALAEGARLIDVREPAEFSEAYIAGAELVPLATLPTFDGIAPGETVYVTCKSGGRSAMGCEFLNASGVQAFNVLGGMMAWLYAGFEAKTTE